MALLEQHVDVGPRLIDVSLHAGDCCRWSPRPDGGDKLPAPRSGKHRQHAHVKNPPRYRISVLPWWRPPISPTFVHLVSVLMTTPSEVGDDERAVLLAPDQELVRIELRRRIDSAGSLLKTRNWPVAIPSTTPPIASANFQRIEAGLATASRFGCSLRRRRSGTGPASRWSGVQGNAPITGSSRCDRLSVTTTDRRQELPPAWT
jgi:hypothetical protein